ncbi:sugar-binding transcriptional regulator [Mycolicibacterium sp. YH-1]|uniref:sugar-binding transcriptional regulator n=1 Tax=Mycolicibacterium sp. YH-1 TaxID=2908837 RepID=UPI001F4BDC12|nr:sugar-binding transcriptional regulator [Mycolicibacterium sp. YH-1]UNB50189.1 sugar-binding transcriptional regulator [Mycolicibacterium sp. YH-1]
MSAAADESRTDLLLYVAQCYYEQGRTQEDIGSELHLTRWKVGRLLDEARGVGLVQIKIVHPQARRTDLEVAMRSRFGLRECVVVPGPENRGPDGEHIAAAAANYLKTNSSWITTLGVSWGNTLQQVAAVLPDGWTRGIEVIQANGGVSRSVHPTRAANIVTSIAHSGNGRATLLPVPAIVERIETRDALYTEGFVVDVLSRARKADALLFSLGALGPTSVLVESGAVTPAELAQLDSAGACGDILAHYITTTGEIAYDDIDRRTVGLSLDDVKTANCAIAVAAGTHKVPVINGALASGLCSVLITDEPTALAVLEHRHDR